MKSVVVISLVKSMVILDDGAFWFTCLKAIQFAFHALACWCFSFVFFSRCCKFLSLARSTVSSTRNRVVCRRRRRRRHLFRSRYRWLSIPRRVANWNLLFLSLVLFLYSHRWEPKRMAHLVRSYCDARENQWTTTLIKIEISFTLC